MRAGAHALSLLAAPLNVQVVKALEYESRSSLDLRRAAGSPPQTTIRSHLRTLAELGIIDRRNGRGPIDYELGPTGGELLQVTDSVHAWLAAAPGGPLQLGSVAAKNAIKALIDGWSSTIVRALAARPLSLTELSNLISGLNYPSLERRLMAMRLVGLVEARPGKTRGTPYAVTNWMRAAIAPLTAAMSWEQQHRAAHTARIGRIDIESMFLLAAPILKLGPDVTGACRLAVEIEGENGATALAGVLIRVERGRLVSCVSRLQGDVDAWLLGTAEDWIGALLERDSDGVEAGGNSELATTVLDGLQRALFGARERA